MLNDFSMLYSDHFINGPNRLYVLLTLLFHSMIVHGFSPDGFNVSTVHPLVKNKRKSLTASSNYRAIALSSPLSKIFDWVILNKNVDELMICSLRPNPKVLQHCTFALMVTINYYRHNNTDVYVLLLDASQAFDKVNYVKVFCLLVDRNFNPMVIRCLLWMYTCPISFETSSGMVLHLDIFPQQMG